MIAPGAFARCYRALLASGAAHPGSAPAEADWIRWIGVGVAVAGALIATPDGTVQAWRQVAAVAGRVRGWLARYLPFLRRTVTAEAKASADIAFAAEAGSVEVWTEWDAGAQDPDKIEILHQQVDLNRQQIADVRREGQERESALRAAIEQSAASQRDAHRELIGSLEEKERRAARVDARGIWPIGFGIILTGIPGELAHFPLLGWCAVVLAVGRTLWVAAAVIAESAGRTA